ncbi:MAG TPA: DUF5990 family protein [Pyrinomonadaceae bacterium]|nr:DUF5990 family protein [Pyrinomonadaceae bacterium]
MEHEIKLRIVLESPPAGVDFGVQKGKGNNYETIQTQRSKGQDLSFEFTVRLKTGDHARNFLGPFVHGPTGERFVYIDIGTCAGQIETGWSRRLKIPLKGIPSDLIDNVLAEPLSQLEARVQGTGRDGGPTCGTVKPFTGWKLRRYDE